MFTPRGKDIFTSTPTDARAPLVIFFLIFSFSLVEPYPLLSIASYSTPQT